MGSLADELQSCRETSLLAQLVIYVNSTAHLLAWRGDFPEAVSLIGEAESIAAATGTRFVPYAAMVHAGLGGKKPMRPG